MKKRLLFCACLFCAFLLLTTGCANESGLNRNNPVTLTLWHNFGADMKETMDELVDEFNSTIGKEKGIIINVTSVSGSASLQEKFAMIAEGDPGAPKMPDIATCYPSTAVLLQQKGLISSLDEYFSQEELSSYLPKFIEEGRLSDGGLYVFPVAKSTEVLFVNKTLFDRFSEATGVSLDSLSTFEGIAEASLRYYEWTDSQTPNIQNDGKNFYTADSTFNLAQVGMSQLGESLFSAESLNLSSSAYKRIWDVLYEPALKGGFSIYNGYSSDLSKTGDIVCSTGSTAGILFYGDQITYPDNTKENVEYTVLPFPTFRGGEKIAMQRGNGMIVAKSTKEKELAASIFLKWFTSPEQNLKFVSSTGYLPVTDEAFEKIVNGEADTSGNENIRKLLETAVTVYREYDFYIPPVFSEFNSLSGKYEDTLYDYMLLSRQEYLEYVGETAPQDAYINASKGDFEAFIEQFD